MAWITRKAVFGVLAALITAILLKMQEQGVERLVNYVYNTAETFIDNNLNYHCPKYAAKYLREPLGEYIAERVRDVQRLKEQFDSFEHSEEVVNVVYLVGVPGSGKTELARQFGKSMYCKQSGAPVVVTLNTEDPYQFKTSLASSIWYIEEGSNEHSKDMANLKKDTVNDLFHRLKELLRKRPGWLVIIDNIRDPNFTQKDIYQHLPIPGASERWGTGKMLITTQIPLNRESYGRYFRTVKNTGLILSDATNFLRKLVNESRRCDEAVIKTIVEKLELFPLSIKATGLSIRSEMKINETYRCRDYLSKYSAELGILLAQNRTVTGYNVSMLAALHLTITNTLKVHSNVYRDFVALIGFTTVDQRTIRVEYVNGYLKKMGHTSEECQKVLDFPLVYFSETHQLFRVHQVVSYAFREALYKTNTNEMLQKILQSISHYFADHYNKSNSKHEIKFHYLDLLQSLPTCCTCLDTCLMAPDAEYFDSVINLIFEAYFSYEKLDCSKLLTLLFGLRSSPVYRNRISVQLQFKGYQVLAKCYRFSNLDGPYLAATMALTFIKDVAREHPELHTLPVSWFLLNLDHYYDGSALYHDVNFFLLFPHYLKFPYDTYEIRRKLCLSLYKLTHILIPSQEERVRKYCNPDFNDVRLYRQITNQISYFREYFSIKSTSYRPSITDYHIALGRHIRCGKALEKNIPYGICAAEYKWAVSGIVYGRTLKFYVDCDKRFGLKRFKIAVHKYRAVLVFLDLVDKMQMQLNWKNSNMTCQSVKYQLMTFSTKTELQMASKVKTNMKSFHEKLSLFVDNYCASLHNINVTELHPKFHYWFIYFNTFGTVRYYTYDKIEILINALLQATGLQREETKEITEMLKEIITSTIYVATMESFKRLEVLMPMPIRETVRQLLQLVIIKAIDKS